jgi:methionyl-tRNA formyltransferase
LSGELPVTPQPDDGVSYAAKISKEETRVDFSRPLNRCTTMSADWPRRPAPGSSCIPAAAAERVKLLATELADVGKHQAARNRA